MKKTFAVIGLGQFGRAVTEELADGGKDIIAIDQNPENVNAVSAFLPTAFIANAKDEKALKELGIGEVDVAIVAFGKDIEASILTTVILKQMGVPHIVVRVDNDYYVPIMKKLGADEIIAPQKACGVALANRIGIEDFRDYYKLDDLYCVVSILVNKDFSATMLKDLSTKEKYGVNLVLINRGNKSFVPGGNDQVLANDLIYVVGTGKDVKAFRSAINGRE